MHDNRIIARAYNWFTYVIEREHSLSPYYVYHVTCVRFFVTSTILYTSAHNHRSYVQLICRLTLKRNTDICTYLKENSLLLYLFIKRPIKEKHVSLRTPCDTCCNFFLVTSNVLRTLTLRLIKVPDWLTMWRMFSLLSHQPFFVHWHLA
jgi:hypothetical protein